MQIECTSSCRLDGRCTNKRIMHREGVKHLEVFHTTNGCGAGVRTMDDIAKGKFVCEYRGEVVSAETFRHRRETRYRHRKNHYALGLCSGYLIDAYDKGNIARFINHSCDPNCQIQRWTVNGQYRVGIFALRSIRRGEELTYDYNWNASDFDGITPCKCRSKNCRLFLNKNVLMSNREMDIARESRILLVRNVQRSIRRRFSHLKVERRSDSCSPSSRNAIAEPSRTSDPSSTARAFVNDIISEFCSADVLSKKQLMRFKNELSDRLSLSVASHSSSSQNAHRSFLTFLDLAEIDISNALKKLGPRIDRKRVNDLRLACSAIRKKYIHRLRRPAKNSSVACERRGSKGKRDSKVLSVRTDLAYLDSEILVGSYDPDEDSMRISTDCDSDCVRCICGIQEDDGQMIQCDRCHFWLHADCLFEKRKKAKELSEYVCQLCKSAANRTEPVDILLRPEPDYRLPGCTYYRTLVNSRQLQVRINETVYVQKLLDDTHKAILKRISSNSDKSSGEKPVFNIPAEVDVKEFHRKDLRCFRVERLFVGPEGHRFVFGCYYARPHEVYCEPGRLFYKNELFWTPLFDTLPLDAVVGRCLVLEPSVWSTGRPKRPKYKEADVFICEYQVGKNQRYFEKIPAKNRYYINTEPYNFDKFSEALPLERTFTPFVMVKPESQKTEENVHRRCHQKKISTLNEIINRLKKRSNFFTSATKDGTNDREPECKRPRR
ncbi:hypothetical protein AB6A40_000956 [Gnathostoma spinigerum]|uniref:Histone-lysine N-methyltransferase n=1 Tax=Gnathostoma spinigerum TaxID=75299 RepID=A0ABD6E584_9BILA